MPPKVSVLVPVYNGEKYLAECLDSILAQDFAEMEILIADDGSTDGSLELIERYAVKDKRIRRWRNPTNLGLSRNLNYCLQAARGNYIKYVLQDDKLLSPSAIRQMVKTLDANPEVSLVGSASYVIDPESKHIELRNSFLRSGVIEGKAAILHCLTRYGNHIGEPTVVMFRREQAGRGYNERYQYVLDLDLWYHLLENGRFAYLAEPLCAFRRHEEQKSALNRRSGVDVQEELMLAQYWLGRPWMGRFASRRIYFEHIFRLKKNRGPSARPFIDQAIASLKFRWYVFFWSRYKITRPFKNLHHSVKKRLPKRQLR